MSSSNESSTEPAGPTGSRTPGAAPAAPTPRTGFLKSPLFRRLYLGYVAVILVVTGVIGILIETRGRDTMLRDFEANLEAEAVYLREIAAPWLTDRARPTSALQAQVQSIGQKTGSRLTVIDASGTVIADSGRSPEGMDNHGSRPEIQAASELGHGTTRRFSSTVGADLMYVALRVPEPGAPVLGSVRSALSVASIEEHIRELRSIVLIGAGLAALAGLLLGLVFARRLASTASAVTEAVESISRGGYQLVAVPDSNDEFGRLAKSVNRMSHQLRDRLETISADRNKLLAILGSMVEGVIAVDGDEQVVHMNSVAGRLLGIAPKSSAGKRIWEVTRVVEIPRILEQTQEQDAVSGQVELWREGSADPLVIELTASPLLNATGQRAGAVVVLNDVTELRRLEQVRRDFVANVSHELKTPLTAIRGLVETLIDDRDMERDTAQRFAVKIRDQALRLSTLVTDLLTLARVESASVSSERLLIDAGHILRECAARISPLCTDQSIELVVDVPEHPVQLNADEEDLRQIVGNLLDNAVKYTPESGRVELGVQVDAAGIVIAVSDTGIGIEPRDLDRVFERFYRVDKARSRELGGTGLGLSIVKHLVQSMGGSIEVESTPGQGSTFRVRLPSAEAGI